MEGKLVTLPFLSSTLTRDPDGILPSDGDSGWAPGSKASAGTSTEVAVSTETPETNVSLLEPDPGPPSEESGADSDRDYRIDRLHGFHFHAWWR